MAALIERQHAIARGEPGGLLVPRAGVAGDAVKHDEGGGGGGAPLGVVKSLAVQEKGLVAEHRRF